MSGFEWKDGCLHADAVPLSVIADRVGTPTYVYSASAIRQSYRRLAAAFAPLRPHLHYAIKASPNLNLCKLMRSLGAGMDVVSGGEMERAWLAGTPMREIVFAGVGKSDAEIRAALDGRFSPLREEAAALDMPDPATRGPVGLFNIESESELAAIARIAREMGPRARACVRVNPNVDPQTHEYTTTGKQENKFGIDHDRVPALFDAWRDHPGVELVGLHVHIGSPVPKVGPYVEAVQAMLALIAELAARGHRVEVLDLGGGWPIDYKTGEVPPIEDYAARLVPLLEPSVRAGLEIVLEPGRSLLGNSGILLTRVQHVKQARVKTFVICDAGMNDLIRPSLYRAFHFMWPVAWPGTAPLWGERPELPDLRCCDVVGPICETGDFFARDRYLPEIAPGELFAIFSAGAYGVSMSSHYNDHGRAAEILVDGERITVIAERERLASLFERELSPREVASA